MSLKENKIRITTIVEKDVEVAVNKLSHIEKRTKSAMVAILIEEALSRRLEKEDCK